MQKSEIIQKIPLKLHRSKLLYSETQLLLLILFIAQYVESDLVINLIIRILAKMTSLGTEKPI